MDFNAVIDELVNNLNGATKQLLSGNALGWCVENVKIVQELSSLKSGINDTLAKKDKHIETLKLQLCEKGGDDVGKHN